MHYLATERAFLYIRMLEFKFTFHEEDKEEFIKKELRGDILNVVQEILSYDFVLY